MGNGEWHSAEFVPPGAEDINRLLLVIREKGKGKYRRTEYDFGIYNASPEDMRHGRWNKSGVVLWMQLPKMPGEEKGA